jgi:hypothetical protein
MRTLLHAFDSLGFLPRAIALAGALLAMTTVGVGCADSEDDPPPAQEDAFTGVDFPSGSDIPDESSWAIGMINKACDLDRSVLAGAQGSITRASGGVLYKAKRNGAVIASASATSTFIGAQKRCLQK